MKIYKVTWSDMYADELYVHWCATINEAIAKREAENKKATRRWLSETT